MITPDQARESPPMLILIMGVPGSGKTTLSKLLIQQTRAVYLDNNFIADAFFSDTRVATEYKELRRGIYDALYAIAEANLSLGNSVLLDVPHVTHMQRSGWRSNIQDIANRANATLRIVRCHCSENVLRQRITERAERRDQSKLDNWQEFLDSEPIMGSSRILVGDPQFTVVSLALASPTKAGVASDCRGAEHVGRLQRVTSLQAIAALGDLHVELPHARLPRNFQLILTGHALVFERRATAPGQHSGSGTS